MGEPLVSVVIPVHNAAPYIDECLASVVAQTIGFEQIEIVAVDDGSTDGSADRLDAWASRFPNIRVFHQPNAGSPGAPRNRGIDLARGEYLFFADPDDYLGAEAFERMLAVARRNDSDIVLGRIRGIGRTAATRPFRRSVERGDVVSTEAVWSLTAHKLFRRSLIVDNGLRFAEGARLAEEQPLIVPAYFLARVISVVADYDCYHLVLRDGSHLTRQVADAATFFPIVRFAIETVIANTSPGPDRDSMLGRWARIEITSKFGRWFSGLPAELREEYVERAAEIVDELLPPEVFHPLPVLDRIRAELVRRRRTSDLVELSEYERSALHHAPGTEAPVAAGQLAWLSRRRGRIAFAARSPLPAGDGGGGTGGRPSLFLRHGGAGAQVVVPLTQEPEADGCALRGTIDLTALATAGLRAGRWHLTIGPEGGDPARRKAVRAPHLPAGVRLLERTPVWRPGWLASVEVSGHQRSLVLVVADWRRMGAGLLARGRRLAGRFSGLTRHAAGGILALARVGPGTGHHDRLTGWNRHEESG